MSPTEVMQQIADHLERDGFDVTGRFARRPDPDGADLVVRLPHGRLLTILGMARRETPRTTVERAGA